jgi:uncharacterized membrane protein
MNHEPDSESADRPSKETAEATEIPVAAAPKNRNALFAALLILRNRVLAGFFVALPIIVTFIVIRWLYNFIAKDIISTIARWLLLFWSPAIKETGLPAYIENFIAPVGAIGVILAVLFLLGMLFQSRTHRLFDWTLKKMPFIGTIYSAVSNAIESLTKSRSEAGKYQRVVLVEFPHPGTKVPAFVTSSCREKSTGETILCVYVPTTPIPTSGYMLLVPEQNVTEISWDLSETLQAIVSGGITVPEEVEYYQVAGLLEQTPKVATGQTKQH